jgi:hypothetical protein
MGKNLRYIFRYSGIAAGDQAGKQLETIQAARGLKVVDDSMSPGTLLVEAPPATIKVLQNGLSDWQISPELTYKLPDTRLRASRQGALKKKR